MRRAAAFASVVSIAIAVAPAHGTDEVGLRYRVGVDAALRVLRVSACFVDEVPRVLVPGRADAVDSLIDARGPNGPLPIQRGRIDVSSLARGQCARYRVAIDGAIGASGFVSGRWGDDVMTSAGTFLWRPPRLPRRASVRFDLAPGVSVLTPYPQVNGEHELDTSAFQRPTFLAFGRLSRQRIERAGAIVDVARLGDGWQLDPSSIERWMTRAIDGIATVQGRFPVPRLAVLLVPMDGRGMAFGMVRRGGGYSVAFIVGRRSTAADLEQSWITWHELSHLQLPALPQRDAWLYEGLATYYQEVLPARLGVQSQRDAWLELLRGFERGARSPSHRALALESENMMQNHAFSRVYWAGTAFALEADVALRERGSSLDEAIRRSSGHWHRNRAIWSSQSVCSMLDRPLDAAILGAMRERYARGVGFPDIGATVRRLGVRRGGDRVELRPAELSRVRDAIMQRR